MADFCYDACSLIYLTKIKVKELLPGLGRVTICGTVRQELLEDEQKYPDATILKKNIEKYVISVDTKVQPILPRSSASMGAGELETMAFCMKSGAILVCDDRQAINHALGLGLKPKTSELILLDLLNQDIISETEFNARFHDLATIKQLKVPVIEYFNKKAIDIVSMKKSIDRTKR